MNNRNFLLILILFISTQVFSQNSNEIRIYYGISESHFLRNVGLDGSATYDNDNFNEFGIRYIRQITKRVSLETGINYLSLEEKIGPSLFSEVYITPRLEKLELITVPIYANFTFWKYFFVAGGPFVDYQITENSSDSQTGIGYSIGFGGKYSFRGFSLFLNPNFKRHALIPFEKETYHQKLTELGVQFGIGYEF